MTDAPERIWAFYSDVFGAMWTLRIDEGATEYIRADLYTALQTRLAEVEKERDSAKGVGITAIEVAEAHIASLQAQVEAMRGAARVCEGSSARGEDIFFAILAMIDNPEPTK